MFEESAGEVGDWNVPGLDRPQLPAAVVLPPAVLVLQQAAEGLADWHPDQLDGPVALATMTALLAVERQVAAARTRSLTDIEARKLHHLDGAPTTSRWLNRNGGGQLPAGDVTLARKLGALPLVADELAAGRISVPTARLLQSALTRLRPHLDRPDGLIDGQDGEQALLGVIVNGVRELVCRARGGFDARADAGVDDAGVDGAAFDEAGVGGSGGDGAGVGGAGVDGAGAGGLDPGLAALIARLAGIVAAPTGQLARLEAAFLVLAGHLEPGQLSGALGELVDALLPMKLQEKADRAELERGLTLVRKPDGAGWRLAGDLDLLCGERLHTVLQAELTRDPDAPVDTELAGQLRGQGLDPYDVDLDLPGRCRPRSRRERMHDALHRGLTRYLGADLGGAHDKNPVQILVTSTSGAIDGEPGALPARTASGARLPAGLVRRLSCGSALTRLALALTGRVLEVSHTERTLKAHERRALHAQTGGICQAAGCRRSAADLGAIMHPHHAQPWATTGSTSLRDTVLVCDSDHADIHHGHIIELKDGRRLGPDGWVA
jgi:hypothetical protein